MVSPMSLFRPRPARASDADAANLAKDLLFEYRRSKSLLRALSRAERSGSLPDEARVPANKLRLSQESASAEIASMRSRYLGELFSIVAFGVESGADVGEALELFVRRLEGEMSLKNKLKAKMGGAQALTYLGMGVFFPLFSSISSVILGSSAGLFGGDPEVSSGFALVSAAYVPMILLISASFAHPEDSFLRNASSVAPYLAAAFCIMLFVPNVLLHVL